MRARRPQPRWTPGAAMLVVALAHTLLFLGVFKLRLRVTGMFYYELGSDTQHVYWPAAQKLLAGRVPYVDPRFFVEYPPLGAAFFLLPALLHPATLRAYDWLFAAQVLAVDLATLPLLARLARRQGVSAVGAVAAYGLLLPLLGSLVSQRYDLVPATLTLGAILALLDRRPALAWGLLLLATLLKLYPAVLAPLFLLYEWRSLPVATRRGRDWGGLMRRGRGVALYAAGLAGATLAWQLVAPASLARFIAWETRRGIEIESLWGTVAELAHVVTGLPAHKIDSYGSYDVVSAVSPALTVLSTVATAGLLAAIYVSYARRAPSPLVPWLPGPRDSGRGSGVGTRPSPTVGAGAGGEGDSRLLVTYATLAVLAVLLGSKLLSIQFLLWLLPLLAAQPHRPRRVVALALGVVLLSQWIYPMHWHDLWNFVPGLILQLALRNALLAAIFILLWRDRDRAAPGSIGALRVERAP